MPNPELDKLRSLRLFRAHRFPVLPFEVLSRETFVKQIRSFCKRLGITRFMIRTDGGINFSPSINNATLRKDQNRIGRLFAQGHTVFVMHPGNIHRNYHSVNIMRDGDLFIVEAVGPGFNAQDLNRYGFFHEQLELDTVKFSVLFRWKVSHPVYRDQVSMKVQKITIPKLQKERSYLLKHAKYTPLTRWEIDYVLSELSPLKSLARTMKTKNFVASMSFIDLGKKKPEPIFGIFTRFINLFRKLEPRIWGQVFGFDFGLHRCYLPFFCW